MISDQQVDKKGGEECIPDIIDQLVLDGRIEHGQAKGMETEVRANAFALLIEPALQLDVSVAQNAHHALPGAAPVRGVALERNRVVYSAAGQFGNAVSASEIRVEHHPKSVPVFLVRVA